ncbi:Gfo/Idh/MocA family protein [Microlunatus antarcticus]|uniref:Putative dehydrogenase n=1 Tax=Microlunatus antarcticus TaxID=53388 RepID=A0A7W5JV65_9ACTN|nr:Gfo/Idh/MocA family oxidoreductase [Microlunatus antarcticus]MBB3326896.1 putative dehydrogenase [Microlunatus antarcticus]
MPVTLPRPRLLDPASVPALRWGVIGTGIAGPFVSALHRRTTQRAVAVVARDQAKTEAFAREHGIGTVHRSVSALIEDPQVDVVYVATPHPLHHAQALEAVAAGKHVLVEKPIAMSAAEAREITDAGRAAGVLVQEAMWTRYLPQSDVIRQVLADGLLGDVRLVRADFGFVFPFDADHRLWNAELGGGALLDAGVYPISFASSVLGPPDSVTAVGSLAPTGVDERADLLLPSGGATALASTSLVARLPVTASVMGSQARLDVWSPFFGPTGLTLTSGSATAEETSTWRDQTFDRLNEGLAHQAVHLAAYVGEGRLESPVHPHAELVSIMATIDEARRQLIAAG